MKKTSSSLIFVLALILLVQPVIAEASIELNGTRNVETTNNENIVRVHLNLSITENIAGLIIAEQIPTNFSFVNSTSSPPASAVRINVTTNEVKWLFISLEQTRELTIVYTLEISTEFNEASYNINGNWKATSSETEATGVLPTTEMQTESTTDTPQEHPISAYYIIAGMGAVIIAAVVITIILARRDSFTRS